MSTIKSYKDLFEDDPQLSSKCDSLINKILDINVLLSRLDLKISDNKHQYLALVTLLSF